MAIVIWDAPPREVGHAVPMEPGEPDKSASRKPVIKLQDDAGRDPLTVREAYLAMLDYLCVYAERAGDDLLTLVVGSSLEADGEPFDPGALSDYLESVERARAGIARTALRTE